MDCFIVLLIKEGKLLLNRPAVIFEFEALVFFINELIIK
jgi:hypothetical protein